ncbi:MAG: hypothetical protein Q4B26_07390 [Eubacteriales bacterium]|nr:hypothetical protein [Eubacteriales bacterium]
MIRKDIVSGAHNGSGEGEKDGTRKEVKEESITVYCRCGQRLFDMERSSTASVSIKCQKCRAVMVVTMKNQKYKCMDQRMMAYAKSFAVHAER